jgi:MoaA/NifB/PqqE/SkfB family radical SAM enzyme
MRRFFHILSSVWTGHMPGQLVVQFTDHCNACCPQCGMNKTNHFPRNRLDVDEIKRMLDAAAQKGICVVSFTGGEPMLHFHDLISLINHAGQAGIEYVRTGTNGFIFSEHQRQGFHSRVTRIAETLAGTPLRNFWISIDSSLPDVHEQMRGFKGLIGGIEKALPIFHEHGIFPSANLGINRNIAGESTRRVRIRNGSIGEIYRFQSAYMDAFRSFYHLVEELGFTIVNSCYPMSIESCGGASELSAVYAATSREDLVRYNKIEKAVLFKAMFLTIPEFRHRIRIFSPLTSLRALFKSYSEENYDAYPCRGGIDAFFVDSREGNTYPCGYRGNENLGKFWVIDLKRFDAKKSCRLCDWECFRDPSELFGPLLQARSSPFGLLHKIIKEPEYFAVWWKDLSYYRACDLFDGRRPPRYWRLAKFASNVDQRGKSRFSWKQDLS